MNKKLKVTVLNASVALAAGLLTSGLSASEAIDTVTGKVVDAAESLVESASLEGLNSIFDKAELNAEFNSGSPEFELGVLKAYGENNADAFIFNQIGINGFDGRTTLNLGLGYRTLNADQTWMGGINAFYDHEFPDNHKRSSVGIELVSSAVQLRANKYNAITGFIKDKSGTDQSALDGEDISLKVALPYLPGAFFDYTKYKWKGVEAAKDSKGQKYNLGGKLSDNLALNVTYNVHDDASVKDKTRVELSYHWNFGQKQAQPTLFNTADTAYQLAKLTTQKYDLVERENRIIKQKKFSVVATGF